MKLEIIGYFLFILLHLSESKDSTDDNQFCSKEDAECSSAVSDNESKSKLYRLPTQDFVQDFDDRGSETLKIECLSTNPSVFTVKNFLSGEECDHFIENAKEEGLQESATRAGTGTKPRNIRLMDMNQDRKLSVSEMILTLEDSYDMYLDDNDIEAMYNHLAIDTNHDKFITPDELNKINPAQLEKYIDQLAAEKPVKKSRFSKQVWLYPDTSEDAIFKRVQERVQRLVKLPLSLIKSSDFQVVRYGVGGHYNAHHDSSKLFESPNCCTRKLSENCRLCRFATVLFYLNDVEEGGGTAFPLANNDTYDVHKFRMDHMLNLQKYCDKANLVVQPERGKAVFWYNHRVNEDTGLLGELDEMTWHGGCPVIKGEKWIANFWIKSD